MAWTDVALVTRLAALPGTGRVWRGGHLPRAVGAAATGPRVIDRNVTTAPGVREAAPDLIVLDLRLPDVPGEEVAREVRAASAVPIMMLTAKTGIEDRIHGL